MQEVGGKRGAQRGPAFHGPQNSAIKIKAGSEEGRWECEGDEHRVGVLISERGLGPRRGDRGSGLLSRASFFQTDAGGRHVGDPEPRALALWVDLTHAAFL